MKRKNIFLFSIFACVPFFSQFTKAQYPVKIHSHNDYTRSVPFYEAYSHKIYSLEADMFYRDGIFYVCHDEKDINPQHTFESMYLQPLISLYKMNNGKAWPDEDRLMQLLIEIKSNNTHAYMDALVAILTQYPEIFNPEKNPNAVRITITGRIPAPDQFSHYPSFVKFDGNLNDTYTEEQLKQVALFSVNFRSLSHWNGKGTMVKNEKEKMVAAINKAHALGKPIRFWGAPDGITAWNTFYWLGIDYINTDNVERCAEFFSDWENKNYEISFLENDKEKGIVNTNRLDKTTRNFKGFNKNKLRLSKTIQTYMPSFFNDGANLPVKNVIFLIGNGMGLAQIQLPIA